MEQQKFSLSWHKVCVHRMHDPDQCVSTWFSDNQKPIYKQNLSDKDNQKFSATQSMPQVETYSSLKHDSCVFLRTRNCDGRLEGLIRRDVTRNTSSAYGIQVPTFDVLVFAGENLSFKRTFRSPIHPVVTFHPRVPNLMVVSSYPMDARGITLQAYDVSSGAMLWSRAYNEVDADWNAVMDITFDRKGNRVIICVKEETYNRTQYLTKFFVVEITSQKVIQKSKACLLKACHEECVINVRMKLSLCDGFVFLTSLPGDISYRLPEERTLKELARKTVLRSVNCSTAEALPCLDIPHSLKLFLAFE